MRTSKTKTNHLISSKKQTIITINRQLRDRTPAKPHTRTIIIIIITQARIVSESLTFQFRSTAIGQIFERFVISQPEDSFSGRYVQVELLNLEAITHHCAPQPDGHVSSHAHHIIRTHGLFVIYLRICFIYLFVYLSVYLRETSCTRRFKLAITMSAAGRLRCQNCAKK